MAHDSPVLSQRSYCSSLLNGGLLVIAALITANNGQPWSTSYCSENEVYHTDWFHCPQGWTLFKNRCFKVTQILLTWLQAQAMCRSQGGNLVTIESLCEQEWLSHFVSKQLGNVSTGGGSKEHTSTVAGASSVEAWIGFIQLPNKTFQWADGHIALEHDGFWAVDGLKASDDSSVTKLCCDIKEQSAHNRDLRWQLRLCDELHSSVCELRPCEEHAVHCADGSKCISQMWLCDGHWDCQDGSDEKDCKKSIQELSMKRPQNCGAVLKEQSGSFSSLNYPEEYPPFLNCLWRIETAPPQTIELLVESLDIEEKYDSLNFYEGTEVSENQLIASFGGRLYNQTVRSLGSFLTVQFVSDHSVQGNGFLVSWRAGLETQTCGGEMVAGNKEAVLSFPLPEHTSASRLRSLSCDWIISSYRNTDILSLQFKNITLEIGNSIAVYDGRGPDAPIITHITSSTGPVTPSAEKDFSEAPYTHFLNIPPVITSSGPHLLLRVIINRGSSLSSFVVAYKNGCNALISTCSSVILSPGYPKSQYPNNLNCTWTVSKDKLERHVTLLFLPHFVTEFGRDYVEVLSFNKEQQASNVIQLSGHNSSLQPGISSHHGFIIKFESDSTVNRGRWAAVTSYDCGVLSVLSPLVLNSSDVQFGSTVGFTCLEGFRLEGPVSAVCGWKGHWVPPELPTCSQINCGTIPVPHGAYLTNITGLTYGSFARFQCMHGYKLIGHHEAVCGELGWQDLPSCKLITCPKEYPPAGGNARAEEIIFGYMREFFCRPNLQLIGSKFSHCNISGQWTDRVPVCEAQKCPGLQGVLNGQLNITGPVEVSKSVLVTCDEGYLLTGHDVLTCMSDLQFDVPLPTCLDIDECNNSEICDRNMCQNFPSGYSCFCQKGYEHRGNSSHICTDINECGVKNGECSHACINMPGTFGCDCPHGMSLYEGPWTQIGSTTLITNRTCVSTCKEFVIAERMQIVYRQKPFSIGEFLFDTKADLICPNGLFPNGPSVISCQAGGGWIPSVTNCTELYCETPRDVSNGSFSCSSLTLGSSVTYSCEESHVLVGPRIRFCEPKLDSNTQTIKLVWSESEPTCIYVTCPELHNPEHGTVHLTSTTINSIAVFRCQCGYQLVGQSVGKCMPNGHWSFPSPICEAQSCLHPGRSPQSTMFEHTPGFPVESLVRFKCVDKGYHLSSHDPIKCLAYKQSKVSTVKPTIDLTIMGYFVPAGLVSVTSACISTYRTDVLIKEWFNTMTQLCHDWNVAVDIQKNISSNLIFSSLNFTIDLRLSSDNTSSTCSCHQKLLSNLPDKFNPLQLISQNSSCATITLSLHSSLTIRHHWVCVPGLRLENNKQTCGQEKLPSCMEDCIDEGLETLTSTQLPSSNGDSEKHSTPVMYPYVVTTPATETNTQSEMLPTLASTHMHVVTESLDRTTLKQTSSTSSAEKSSVTTDTNPTTTELENTKVITVNTKTSDQISTTQQTQTSTRHAASAQTTLEMTLTSDPTTLNSQVFNSKQTTTKALTSQQKATSEEFESTTTKSSISTKQNSEITVPSTWPSDSTTPFIRESQSTTIISSTRSPDLDHKFSTNENPPKVTSSSATPSHLTKDREFFTTNPSEVSRKSSSGSETTQRTTSSPWSAAINCTSTEYSFVSQENQVNSSQLPASNWSQTDGLFSGDINTTDCMTTHALEKHTVTLVQGPSVPSIDLSFPVYSVEIYDYILGSFANISCIDTVHASINVKVNELLQDFVNRIGNLACRDAPDVSLEMSDGNIRFGGTRAKIFVKFSITYTASSKSSVAFCGMEFQSYIADQLPRKLEKVEKETSVSDCRFVNYTGRGFNISYHGWSCHSGYTLDEVAFLCFHASVKESPDNATTIMTTSSPPVQVFTVPSAQMIFAGIFTSTSPEDQIDDLCIKEYKVALIRVLSMVEQNLNSRIFSGIYTVTDKDINITINEKKVIAEVVVNLIPLLESVDLLYMSKCANFTSLQFREPSQKTLSVTASWMSHYKCPVLILSAHGFRTDTSKMSLYCAHGYIIDKSNFKCINESLPLHSTRVEITMKGTYDDLSCRHVIQTSAEQLIKDVLTEIQNGLLKGIICNGTKIILFWQDQGNVSIGNQGVNITIPVILVNLQFNKSETLDCIQQIYNYLKSTILQPISTMIGTLSTTCRATMSVPQNYRVLSKRWTCLPGRVYNPLRHYCEVQVTPTPTQTEHKVSDRGKRSIENLLLRPQWNASLPTCIDVESPTFHSCPAGPVVINLGTFGLIPATNPLPTVTDNSGIKPRLTVSPNISPLYRFCKNTTVVMVAEDEAGNMAKCTFNLTIIDQVPPTITCPRNLMTVSANTWQGIPHIKYNNTSVTAIDNSGCVNILYDPPDGAAITASEIILVTASAVDGSMNKANCSFFARVQYQGCSEKSVPHTEGVTRSCVRTGDSDEDLSCVVSCSADRGFAVQPPEMYNCSGKSGTWQPHNRVPQCIAGRFPNFEVRLSFDMPYQGNTTGDCLKEMLDAVIESVKLRFSSACVNATQDLNFTNIDSVGAFHKGPMVMMAAKLKISIQLAYYNMTKTTTPQWCGSAALNHIEFNDTLIRSCGQLKLSTPVAKAGKDSCPRGFAYVGAMCYQCPAGSFLSKPECKNCSKNSYQNMTDSANCMVSGFGCPQGQYSTEPKCIECPVGTFQNLPGSSECINCTHGYSTLHVGAQDKDECIAECKSDHFSVTGLEPCLHCPVGTHQPKPGSTDCKICNFDSNGRWLSPYCKKLCVPGEYSSLGTIPCMPCPKNYYSHINGSTTCLQCPDNKVTKSVGSRSQADCEVHNPCQNNPCQKGSQCQPYGTTFVCECLPGFTGPACQNKMELCDNQTCENCRSCQNNGNKTACPCPLEVDHCFSNPCVYGYCTNTATGFSCSCYSGYHGNKCHMKIDNCAAVICYNEGSCVDDLVGFHCTCAEGFTGRYCDVSTDKCEVNNCHNGGICTHDSMTLSCLCPEGFTGDLCEVNIDECTSSPCLNKGVCLDSSNSYRCLCLPEYIGHNCESLVDPCEAGACQNEAVCVKTLGSEVGFHCECKEGYTGERCEIDIDFCQPMPCSLQGSSFCEDCVSSFKCHCLPGWTGDRCDEQMDPCSRDPCYNGAVCDNRGDTFTCICPPMFTGPTCLVSLNSCESNSCQNSGSCLQGNASFSCLCPPGFTGSLCEENINECESNPCLNRGLCQDGVNAFFCSCCRGFAGELCETNIDECLSHPCQHNSSCTQLAGDFKCNCTAGFTGKQCETDIDECSPNPCQHQGKCVDQTASFYCTCPKGYTGAACEETVDKCQDNITCLNNATCHEIDGKVLCICTHHFTGPDCGKKKTANFDLRFVGDQSVKSQQPVIHAGNLSELSLCLWVKFNQPDAHGTYLVLTSEEGHNIFLTLSGFHATAPVFASEEINLNSNDGMWQHLCVVMTTSHWMIFRNGENLTQGQTTKWLLQNSLKLILGQPASHKDTNEWFKGYLHGVNIYNFALDQKDVQNMSQSCDIHIEGNVFDWVTADSHLFGSDVTMPSQCGENVSLSGDQIHLISSSAEDKVPPEIVNCPSTIVVTSQKSLVSVTWAEPEFTDNIGIVSVKQNYRPGQIFAHGQYLVTYIGYDAENNSAECSFQIFVRKLKCLDPPPPVNGARVCGEWDHGRYCIPSCTHNFHFLTPVPPFYRCGNEGIWNPSSGDPLIFPICTRTYLPAHTIYGAIHFEGPECTSIFKLKLQEKLSHVLLQLDGGLHLCGTDPVCNYTQGLNTECDNQIYRKKRSQSSEKSLFTVKVNFTLSLNLSDKVANPNALPEKVIHLIKNDQTGSEFVLVSVDLHLSSYCQLGQILINPNRPQCLNCPAGYFMATESLCSPCPKGQYNDQPLQTVCKLCPEGLTTNSQGTTSVSQCFAVCQTGCYFSVSKTKCEPCPKGEYQSMAGQSDCTMCPPGLTTQSMGAKSAADCQDVCQPGQELGVHGTCVDCPYGTYRTENRTSSFCISCPYGWTTDKEKATDVSQCSIKKCTKGYYHNAEDKSCRPCPLGTYQTSKGATSCQPCGVRLTTYQEGADSRSLCRPGKVNECDLKIDNCGQDTQCLDLDDGYKCECKHGTTSAGQCVDVCEKYCSSLKFCNNGATFQDRDCHCSVEMCKDEDSRDTTYESLIITSITVTVIATLILLAIIIICIYRRNRHMGQEKHVRMYRDETELASFTNEAFDSFSTHLDLHRDEPFWQISNKVTTRWHSQHFMVQRPNLGNDIELADL